MITQGDVCWVSLPIPVGSEPGYRRPVIVVQGEFLNRSRIRTAVCVALTTNLHWQEAPGNVLLGTKSTGLPQDTVANVSQIVTIDRSLLSESVGRVPARELQLILTGIDIVLGRS